LAPAFTAAGVPYPPERFVIAAFKLERELHLLAAGPGQPVAFVKPYPILAASGGLGPKLREGDRQVPEGIYGIESLNPNSRFHLALRVDYPNMDDRARAARDGRMQLGGDIMIHGNAVSVGCLAIGDAAAEELFVLAAETGCDNARVVIAPVDFRRRQLPTDFTPPVAWTAELYGQLERAVMSLPFSP
jgi:murein L,D-transpeptidase YafK